MDTLLLLFNLVEIYRTETPSEEYNLVFTSDRETIQDYQEDHISIQQWEGGPDEGETIYLEKSISPKIESVEVKRGNLTISKTWSRTSDNSRTTVAKRDWRKREIKFTPNQRQYLVEQGFEIHGAGWATKANP